MPATRQQKRQRARLETLADVVYGVTLVVLVSELPTPRSEGMEAATVAGFLHGHYPTLVASGVGVFLVVGY